MDGDVIGPMTLAVHLNAIDAVDEGPSSHAPGCDRDPGLVPVHIDDHGAVNVDDHGHGAPDLR